MKEWHFIADDDFPSKGQFIEAVNTFNDVQTAEYTDFNEFYKIGTNIKLAGIWAWRENPQPPEKPEKCKCDLMNIKNYCNNCWVRKGKKR